MAEKLKYFEKMGIISGMERTAEECNKISVHVVHYPNCLKQYGNVSERIETVLADTKSPPAITCVPNEDDSDIVKIIENEKTPHSNKRLINAQRTKQQDDLQPTKTVDRCTPLPVLKFADSKAVWLNMVYKEEATMNARSPKIFADRTSYLPRMRAILLDWIMEVCEVYRLRRTTYYLTVDYVDRYLTLRPTVPKTQLQLLGVSCLFVAAKLEEIYPPKLTEFSYVCDGACTEAEILACELLLLNTLTWDVNPITPTSWLSLYMQIFTSMDSTKKLFNTEIIDGFQFPQYSAYRFVMASQLIDLFTMDPGFLRFSYSVIAAGAVFYTFGKDIAIKVSGLKWEQFKGCVKYMSVFHKILESSTDPRLRSAFPTLDMDDHLLANLRFLKKRVPNLVADELHCLQTHLVDLDFFERAIVLRMEEFGIHIEKLVIRKKKKSENKLQKSSSESEEAPEESTVVVYEVENILQTDKCEDEEHKTEENGKEEKDFNIMKIHKKVQVSFDAILSSMHNDCYDIDKYS